MHDQHDGDLWAITSYFNPVGYRRRIENYRLFRQHLRIPLVTVELSFDGSFQLQPEDADVLVQIHGRDVMWQKERLLNIALKQVPNACDNIAWLDCDIVFENDDWIQSTMRALGEFCLVHLFQERCDLPRDVTVDRLNGWNPKTTAQSLVYKLASGDASVESLLRSAPKERLATSGLGWASRREVLEKHGFYDACILGGGDRAILCAGFGKFDHCVELHRMNMRRKEHYLEWARDYFATVGGRVGYVPGRIYHLWHGELQDRRYEERHRDLKAFDFDPFTDIALDNNGCWRWNSGNKELHAFVKRYFESRNEDGAGEKCLGGQLG